MTATSGLITLQSGSLTLTPRTLVVGDMVLPARNIARFGAGNIRRWPFNWWMVSCLGVASGPWLMLALATFYVDAFIGFLMTLSGLFVLGLAGWGAYLLVFAPTRPGLVVSTNAGEVLFFPTQDKESLDVVTRRVSTIFEDMNAGGAQITVTQHNVSMKDVSVDGILNTGSVSGGATTMKSAGGEGHA